MEIELDQVNLVVRDMDAMVEFYELLGLRIPRVQAEWAPHHRSAAPGQGLDFDLDSMAFASVWDEGWPGGTGIVLGFRLPDRESVDNRYEDLTAAGHVGQQPPYDAFWGSRYAIVIDPDGNEVGLMSPRDAAHRTTSPAPPPG